MPQVEIVKAPTAVADKPECWFEINLNFKEDVQRGRPTRVFSSKDERWAEWLKDPKNKVRMGSLCYGSYAANGEDFVSAATITDLKQLRIAEALAEMQKFEKTGVIHETPLADKLRAEEEKEQRAAERQTTLISAAFKDAFNPPRETARGAK